MMEFEDQPWTLVISVCAPRIFIAWKFSTLLRLRQSHQLLHDDGREDFPLKSSDIFVPSFESPDCHTHRFGISFLQKCFVNLRYGISYFNVHELGEQCLDNPQEVPLAVWILPCMGAGFNGHALQIFSKRPVEHLVTFLQLTWI
jgi:hypothetical protein